MQRFAHLIQQLDETNKTKVKIGVLAQYFKEETKEEDKLWAIALFTSRRPKRPVKTSQVRNWMAEFAHIPLWLLEECYTITGDLAETIALLSGKADQASDRSLSDWVEDLMALHGKDEDRQKAALFEAWSSLDYYACFVFNKILTGGFRLGVSEKTLIKGLAKTYDLEETHLSLRLTGNWTPQSIGFKALLFGQSAKAQKSKPYPFYLAYPLEGEVSELGPVEDWYLERKWDGIRGQLVKRGGELFVWSRGGELVTDKYPELQLLGNYLKDGSVLDGELLPYKAGQVLPFNDLQRRIGRKKVGRKVLEDVPVAFMAFDLLEKEGRDWRPKPLRQRRADLEELVAQVKHPSLMLNSILEPAGWEEAAQLRAKSLQYRCEGLMLKHRDSPYRSGRKKGDWWKWKMDPLSIDAVLTYAMRGHGRRANLYTDYTFGIWSGNELVTFAKAYSGLTDEELRAMDHWIRRHTLQRFGPVRQVEPKQVFELAFEGIAPSKRHKSGIALRFPRIKRWRKDKTTAEANTLSDLKRLLEVYE